MTRFALSDPARKAIRVTARAGATLLGLWLFIHLLPRWLPEDPARIAAGEWATPSEVTMTARILGLDLPWHRALLRSASELMHGDLGQSLRYHRSVASLLWAGFPASLRLTLLALGLSVPLAFLMARWRAPQSRLLQSMAIASPVYVLGPLLLWIVARHVVWIPVSGTQGWTAWILPSISLAVPLAGHQARILVAALDELRGSPGLRWWEGCGIPRAQRFRRWLLPGVSGPWLTVLGLQIGSLLGGAVLVETIFSIPELGLTLVGALSSRDLPVVQGAVMLGAALYVLVQLLVEAIQSFLDPRLR